MTKNQVWKKMIFKENIEEKIKEWKYVREIEISLIYVNAIESNVTDIWAKKWVFPQCWPYFSDLSKPNLSHDRILVNCMLRSYVYKYSRRLFLKQTSGQIKTYTLYSLVFKPASFHMAIFFNHKDEKSYQGW